MPLVAIIALTTLFLTIVAGGLAGIFLIARELLAEQQEPVPAWDARAHAQLSAWRREEEKEKRRCPGCQGTRCWSWVRNGQSCKEAPVLAPNPTDILAQGKHNTFTLRPVPSGWWPIPATFMGRTRHDLWEKVAGHVQIPLRYQGALP